MLGLEQKKAAQMGGLFIYRYGYGYGCPRSQLGEAERICEIRFIR
jgi:hypothetical protein